MKKIASILFAAALAAMTMSCSKDSVKPPLHITVSTYNVEFTKAGDSRNIDYCFVGDWSEAKSDADWISTKTFISSEDGSMMKLNITVKENNTGADREGTVILSTIREGKKPGTVKDRIDRVISVSQSAE